MRGPRKGEEVPLTDNNAATGYMGDGTEPPRRSINDNRASSAKFAGAEIAGNEACANPKNPYGPGGNMSAFVKGGKRAAGSEDY